MAAAPKSARHYWLELLITPVVSLLGILIAAVSIYASVKSNNDTERAREKATIAAQRDAEAAAFELAAAQIVMGQSSCKLAQTRAAELVALFPKRLDTSLFTRLTRPYSKSVCDALRKSPPSIYSILGLPSQSYLNLTVPSLTTKEFERLLGAGKIKTVKVPIKP
jgi:hypothetical protein